MIFDVGLTENVLINNKLDAAIQELDILFNTENTQLLGVPEYGVNFMQFLWSLTPAVDSIERYIKNKITTCTFYLAKMSYDINAEFVYTGEEAAYIIHFKLYYNDMEYEKEYILSQK